MKIRIFKTRSANVCLALIWNIGNLHIFAIENYPEPEFAFLIYFRSVLWKNLSEILFTAKLNFSFIKFNFQKIPNTLLAVLGIWKCHPFVYWKRVRYYLCFWFCDASDCASNGVNVTKLNHLLHFRCWYSACFLLCRYWRQWL